MNVTSVEGARALLATLPLDRAKLMEFDLIDLVPSLRYIFSSAKAGRQLVNSLQLPNY
jgi:hypothetical protein